MLLSRPGFSITGAPATRLAVPPGVFEMGRGGGRGLYMRFCSVRFVQDTRGASGTDRCKC